MSKNIIPLAAAFIFAVVLVFLFCRNVRCSKESASDIMSPETVSFETGAGIVGEDAANTDIDSIASSVVKLEVYDDKDNKISTGTGFSYGDRKLVTSAHVIVNMKYIVAFTDGGDSFRIEEAAAFVDEDKDIAMFNLPKDINLPPVTVADSIPKRGTEVFTIGSQAGLVNLVTTGIISGSWSEDGASYLLFTAPVSAGNSGGPVFDKNGDLLGIVIGTYEKGQNLNIALCAKELESE